MTRLAGMTEGDDLHYTMDVTYADPGDAVSWPAATVTVSGAALRSDGARVAATSATVIDAATRRIAVVYTEGALTSGEWQLQVRPVVDGKTATFTARISVGRTAFAGA